MNMTLLFLALLPLLANGVPLISVFNLIPRVTSVEFDTLSVLLDFSPFQAGSWFNFGSQHDSFDSDGFLSTDGELEVWLEKQGKISFESILKNIGGVGIESSNVAKGAVIASPSKVKPNYFYQWVRDAAITIQSLVEYLDDHNFSQGDYDLISAIELYILNSYQLQRLDNKSGTWKSLDGLGEPKFMSDSTPFDEHWGRPQRDGPGLRVITITNYLQLLNKYDKQVSNEIDLNSPQWIYDNIIKPDLKYIMINWFKSGFDLWEEIDSLHLFTALTQLKAIRNGLDIIKIINEPNTEFIIKLNSTFQALRFFIVVDSGFKVSNIPYLIETPSLVVQGKRSGLDIASILGSLRSHDMSSSDSQQIPFPIEDSSVFSTLIALINDMKYRYPINHKFLGSFNGVALGRYPEDLYDGYGITEGNPWFIATATASEFIFKLIYHLYNVGGDFTFTEDQLKFIMDIAGVDIKINSEVKKVSIPFGSETFKQISMSLLNYGDSFLEIIKTHVDGEGHMSEQFNKYSGYLEGAEDLTWSYGSFWSTLRWRQKALQLIG